MKRDIHRIYNDKSCGDEKPDEIQSEPKSDDEEKTNLESENHIDAIFHTGSVITHRGEDLIYCLTIIGQIEGHYVLPSNTKTTKYEHIIPQLVAIDEDENIKGLLLLLNTVGGDVEAGLAIAEMISGMKKPSVSIVIGGGHSIGIPLAVSADKSFIAKSASMTVHPVRTTGLTVGVQQTFEYFQKMQERITQFIVDNSSISFEDYSSLVLNTGELVTDIGTILQGQEAVDCGLIDEVGTLCDATDCLYNMINNKNEENDEE